ncbi:hypothetical protein [Nocardia vinacea]|uniref:hypothetical protein n=1 Tax=Nocardia vinacea TaxID=96468 RepID=UPI0002DD0B7D|nr:hypothetical protein [Nocardia vinacea]
MARVPWAALGGDEIEAVVSNLLYNEHPRAKRIRPSQGDYGLDLIVPRLGDRGEVWDVYQVKKFALNLTGDQKTQIEKSFRRLMFGLARKEIPVGDWYVVMPLDPTPENVTWFAAMPDDVIADMFADEPRLAASAEEKRDPLTPGERAQIDQWRSASGRIVDWKGLNACEAWVAKHWYVTDYYLNGGSERIRNAVADVAKILQRDESLVDQGDQTALLTPAESEEHLLRLQSALDGDPHFRYGVSLDPHVPDLVVNTPGLIAATQRVGSDGSCLTFRIYARFDESLNERPIPIKLNFAIDDPEFDQAAYDSWRKYGTPLSAPAAFEIDLPGGLGSKAEAVQVQVTQADSKQHEIRVRVVTNDGTVVPDVRLEMKSSIGPDRTGVRIDGTDQSGLLVTHGTLDGESNVSNLQFKLRKVSGAEIGEAWPAIALIASMTYPNMVQVAGKYGPFLDLQRVPEGVVMIAPAEFAYLRALNCIQTRTATPIRIPRLDEVTVDEIRDALHAEAMIEGQVVVTAWQPFELESHIVAQLDPAGSYELVLEGAYRLSIGDQEVAITDTVTLKLLSAKLDDLVGGRVVPDLNNTSHQWIHGSAMPPEGRRRVLSRRIDRQDCHEAPQDRNRSADEEVGEVDD